MATQGVRKYYCSNPINDACRKGFVNTSGYTRHRNVVHSAPKHLRRPQLHSSIPELTLPEHEEGLSDTFEALIENAPPEGVYYVKHPVLDGKL